MTTKITSANITQSGTSGISSVSWQAPIYVNGTGSSSIPATLTAGRAYPCDTSTGSGGAFTVTLPASPSAGNVITLTDYAGTWGTNNLTVNPNGLKINGGTTNATLSTNRGSAQIVYVDSTQGWIAYSGFAVTTLPQATPTVDYLLVGGGGAGGANRGGGGGAGGLLSGSVSVSSGVSYSITVGAAGTVTGGAFPYNAGGNGGASKFGTLVNGSTGAIGGGGGGSGNQNTSTQVGQDGGSGGGAGGNPTTGTVGLGTSGQGTNGGTGLTTTVGYGGGGGGGSNTAGSAAASGQAGNGGAGSVSTIISTSVATANSVGQVVSTNVYFSGGGGGGANAGNAGAGGNGGGGAGGVGSGSGTGTAGGANTGGGGGGAGESTTTAGAGGSGVVIISYPSIYADAASTTGSPVITTSGSNKVYIFKGNGSITF